LASSGIGAKTGAGEPCATLTGATLPDAAIAARAGAGLRPSAPHTSATASAAIVPIDRSVVVLRIVLFMVALAF
jgi:hypothetical protein